MVTSADKLRYDAMFKQADKDADGLVSGINNISNIDFNKLCILMSLKNL